MCDDNRIIAVGSVPEAARRAGLGDRFRYWRGRSGESYLFSAVSVDEAMSFRDVVVLFAAADADGQLAMSHATEIDAAGNWADPDAADAAFGDGVTIFVHLLAHGDKARAAVLADLAAGGRLAAAA